MTTETVTVSPGLQHFVDLARRGRHRGCSSGERSARRLALQVIDHCSGLDGAALDGLCEFIQRAARNPTAARRVIG